MIYRIGHAMLDHKHYFYVIFLVNIILILLSGNVNPFLMKVAKRDNTEREFPPEGQGVLFTQDICYVKTHACIGIHTTAMQVITLMITS